MIPKVIHYCWFGGSSLPKEVKKCIESWKKYCPDYQIIEWNESNYDVNKNPFLKEAYRQRAWAFVSDFARLDIVYNEGGYYLDTDVELLKSLDCIESDCFFAIQQSKNMIATGLGFGSIAHHPVLKKMLNEYDKLEFNVDYLETIACPILNTKTMIDIGYNKKNENQIIDGVLILSSKYMDPICPGDSVDLLCIDSISIHHYSASWTDRNNKLKRKLIRYIGQNKINKVKNLFK